MDASVALPLALAVVLLALLGYVAVTDVVRLTIANRTVMVTLALTAAWVVAMPGPPETAPFAMALALFGVGLGLWLAGAMGGGDAKFLPVLGLAGGTAYIHVVLWALFGATLLLLLAFAALRLLAARGVRLPDVARPYVMDRHLPFGVPLAIATAAAVVAKTLAVLGARAAS